MALLQPTLELGGVARSDLVIEAVVENLDVKRASSPSSGAQARPDTVLATNTSSLSIDAIARDTPPPERVVGMHFFNPVHRMPLVEVVARPAHVARPRRAPSPPSRAGWARRRSWCGTGPGSWSTGCSPSTVGGEALLDEGTAIEDIDRAMVDWGMPMGPVASPTRSASTSRARSARSSPRLPRPAAAAGAASTSWSRSGRLGTKNGRGFYRYEGGAARRGPTGDLRAPRRPAAARGAGAGAARRAHGAADGQRGGALPRGAGRRTAPATLDLAMIFGTGFPPFRGGLCRWADARGAGALIQDLERLAATVAPRFAPSPALRAAAEAGGFYAGAGPASRVALTWPCAPAATVDLRSGGSLWLMPSMTLATGTRLGPYEIQSALGAGGMGEVYGRVTPSSTATSR